MAKRMKPKFEVGQVVALWSGNGVPVFYRIKRRYWDKEGELRYRFEHRCTDDTWEKQLCPVEKLLRPLTTKEAGK